GNNATKESTSGKESADLQRDRGGEHDQHHVQDDKLATLTSTKFLITAGAEENYHTLT
ncbi:unnamed protein product, partial [Amoebophrya sp. A25]